MYFILIILIIRIINGFIIVKIHRNSLFYPLSSCSFISNVSIINDLSINSCIWKCVNEYDCQTAIFFKTNNICSMFKEECHIDYIKPSRNDFIHVICYKKNHSKLSHFVFLNFYIKINIFFFIDPILTCSSTSTLSKIEEDTISTTQISMLYIYMYSQVDQANCRILCWIM